jgi:hypothetical protein
MGLSLDQPMVLIIDCWSVHRSQDFREWMKDDFSHFKLLFVLASCTGKAQSADVIQQRPLKAGIKHGFDVRTAREVAKKIDDGVAASSFTSSLHEVKLDFWAHVLKKSWWTLPRKALTP